MLLTAASEHLGTGRMSVCDELRFWAQQKLGSSCVLCVAACSEEEISNMKLELDKYGIQMPAFNKIGGILANELSVDEAAGERSVLWLAVRGGGCTELTPSLFPSVHAAVIAINEAVDRGDFAVTAEALWNPNAMLRDLQGALVSVYQEILQQARRRKAKQAGDRVSSDASVFCTYTKKTEVNITHIQVWTSSFIYLGF